MFETLDDKLLFALGKIDDPIEFHKLFETRKDVLTCLEMATLECSKDLAKGDLGVTGLQQVVKGLISAQNIVKIVFDNKDMEIQQPKA